MSNDPNTQGLPLYVDEWGNQWWTSAYSEQEQEQINAHNAGSPIYVDVYGNYVFIADELLDNYTALNYGSLDGGNVGDNVAPYDAPAYSDSNYSGALVVIPSTQYHEILNVPPPESTQYGAPIAAFVLPNIANSPWAVSQGAGSVAPVAIAAPSPSGSAVYAGPPVHQTTHSILNQPEVLQPWFGLEAAAAASQSNQIPIEQNAAPIGGASLLIRLGILIGGLVLAK